MKALVVDRVPSMRQFLSMSLAEFKLDIDEAESSTAALAAAAQTRYHLVLFGVELSLNEALHLLAAVRGNGAGGAVILLGAAEDAAVRAGAEQLGFGYLSKPVKAHAVRDTARRLLELPEPPAPLGSERRREPRLRIPVRVQFAGKTPRDLVTEDVNALGAFLVCDDLEAVGTAGRVTLFFRTWRHPSRSLPEWFTSVSWAAAPCSAASGCASSRRSRRLPSDWCKPSCRLEVRAVALT